MILRKKGCFHPNFNTTFSGTINLTLRVSIVYGAGRIIILMRGWALNLFLGPEMASSQSSAIWEYRRRKVCGNHLISSS
jgi:hypothetical protein